MSSDKRRKRAAARLVFAPPPRRSSSPHCSSSPVSAHPPTTPCLHSHSGASQLTSLGSGAREPDCRADAPARCSHPPSQLTPHPAKRSTLLPIHSLSRPSTPSRPPPLVGLAYRAMSKELRDAPVVFGERRLRDLYNDMKARQFAHNTGQEYQVYLSVDKIHRQVIHGEEHIRLSYARTKDGKDSLGCR
ncbi:hypothetical protein EV363DRAFT_1167673 [Boletus edulis]|nr:hypothetical protein EV363DRAFT_1167673 [Boletus edulis]